MEVLLIRLPEACWAANQIQHYASNAKQPTQRFCTDIAIRTINTRAKGGQKTGNVRQSACNEMTGPPLAYQPDSTSLCDGNCLVKQFHMDIYGIQLRYVWK